jgi:hypothetical protein
MVGLLRSFGPWLWVGAGALVVLGAVGVIVSPRLKRLMRLAKAAATDPRLPRSVRALFWVGLAAKAMPIDFGVDEVCLGLGIVLLTTRYRVVWAEIRKDI